MADRPRVVWQDDGGVVVLRQLGDEVEAFGVPAWVVMALETQEDLVLLSTYSDAQLTQLYSDAAACRDWTTCDQIAIEQEQRRRAKEEPHDPALRMDAHDSGAGAAQGGALPESGAGRPAVQDAPPSDA